MMNPSPQFLTILSSAPIDVSIEGPIDRAAIGISTICEMNAQRYTALGCKEVQSLIAVHSKGHAFSGKRSEIWGVSLYQEEPVEAVDIQPFSRPQRGNPCLFFMEGELDGIYDNDRFPVGDQWPVSCTDQERAFCLMQERMRKLWGEGRPDAEMRLALVADYAGRLDKLGPHNFIHWDGEFMFAYSSLDGVIAPLAYKVYQGSNIQLNGPLSLSIKAGSEVSVVVVAHQSLLDSPNDISPGQVVCFSQGQFLDSCDPVVFWK